MTTHDRPATRAVRAAIETDEQFGAVVPPLHLSSNFTFRDFNERREYDYTRSGNPTRDSLAKVLADLEQGAGAVVTASGMAALALVMQLVRPGEKVCAPHDCYGGTHRLLTALRDQGKLQLEFVDFTSKRALDQLVALEPRLVLLETPSNPLLRVTDIEKISRAANRIGALVAVDNTFLSPALQQPLTLGADIVVHSTTKYLNGHSDVVGGAVVAASEALHEELAWWANCLGISGSPFDSFLTLRGVRTLHSRLRQHESNAYTIALMLQGHAGVHRVHYPGLPEHPDHELATRQQSGYGGMLSFELAGGEFAVREFLRNLRQFSLAESLGGVESLVAHPAPMTHASMTAAAQREAGISSALIRLSIGIEHVDDLLADLRRALNIAVTSNSLRLVNGGEDSCWK